MEGEMQDKEGLQSHELEEVESDFKQEEVRAIPFGESLF